jgi:hypothetical protein
MPNEDLRIINETFYINVQKYAPEGQILSLVSFFKSVSFFLDYWKNEQAEIARNKNHKAIQEFAFIGIRDSIKKIFDEAVTVCIKQNSLNGNEMDGVIILAAITTKASELKEKMKLDRKTKFGLTDSQIDELIEEGTSHVMNKYLEY